MKIYLSISNRSNKETVNEYRKIIQDLLPKTKFFSWAENNLNFPALYDSTDEKDFAVVIFPPRESSFFVNPDVGSETMVNVGRGSYGEAEFALSKEIPVIAMHMNEVMKVVSCEAIPNGSWQYAYGKLITDPKMQVYEISDEKWVNFIKQHNI